MPAPLPWLAVSPLLAFGHAGGTIAGVDVDPAPTGLFVQTSVGLLTQASPDAPFLWTCHEAITTPDALVTPRYVQAGDAVIAVVPATDQSRDAGETLYRSTDGGCSWTPAVGLTGTVVARVAVDPADPSHAIAVTADTTPGATNGAWVSTDGGASWTATPLGRSDALFLDVQRAGDSVWTASIPVSAGETLLHHSADRGTTWTTTEVDLSGVPRASSTGADPAAARVLIAVGPSEAYLLVDPLLGDTLLHTTDAGGSWTPVLSVGGELLDAVVHADGTLDVIEANRFLHRSTNGTSFTAVPDVPFGVGVGAAGDMLHLAAFPELVGGLVLSGDRDAGPWSPTLAPHEVAAPLSCPADSDHGRVCEPLWADLKVRLDRFTPARDTGTSDSGAGDRSKPTDAAGCACANGGRASGLLAVLLTAAGARARSRRRRRTTGRPSREPRFP